MLFTGSISMRWIRSRTLSITSRSAGSALSRRLAQIRAGGAERFFEEGRSLAAYRRSSRFLWLWRLFGALGGAGCLYLIADLSGLLAG